MSSWNTYQNAINFVMANKKILWMLLLVNLTFALFIALPINSYMDLSIGDSLSMKAFDNGFDYMLISDFLDNYGMGIDAILAQSSWSFLLLFALSIFISGGVLWSIKSGRYSNLDFITGGANFFWKLLKLSIVFVIIYLAVILGVFTIFRSINGGLSPFAIESDTFLVSSFWICTFLCILILTLISVIHNIAKIDILFSDSKWALQHLRKAVLLLRRHFLSFLGIFIINFSLLAGLSLIYFLLRKFIHCEGGLGLLLLMVVAQLYILAKIALNVTNVASFYFMYKNKLNAYDSAL